MTLDDGALALIAREAEGSLRDAQSLLEQVLAAGSEATGEAAVRALLGAADRRLVAAVADGILAGDPRACLECLGRLYAHGYDAQRFCRDLLEHFRHLAVLRVTGDRTLVAELPEAEASVLAAQAERRSADDLQRFFRLLLEADAALAAPTRTIEPQLVLEMAVLRLATLPPLVPLDELIRRLEALEGRAESGSTAPTGSAAPVGGSIRAAPAAPDELWERFLARVRQDKVSLYMTLAAGRALGVEGGALRIGIENEAMRRELTRRETLERLAELASEAAGRALRVEVGPMPEDRADDTPLGRVRRRTEETLADPLVQAAVEIFGAEVRGVRERRP
jgi:DNA polymerase-3 subunit gamma/tau